MRKSLFNFSIWATALFFPQWWYSLYSWRNCLHAGAKKWEPLCGGREGHFNHFQCLSFSVPSFLLFLQKYLLFLLLLLPTDVDFSYLRILIPVGDASSTSCAEEPDG